MQGSGVLKQQTAQFIMESPSSLAFKRWTKVDDGAGGTTKTSVTLSPQTVRVVQAKENSMVERRTISGEVVRPSLSVVCMPDANITAGDTFTWLGFSVEVVWLTNIGYEIIAEVAVR